MGSFLIRWFLVGVVGFLLIRMAQHVEEILHPFGMEFAQRDPTKLLPYLYWLGVAGLGAFFEAMIRRRQLRPV